VFTIAAFSPLASPADAKVRVARASRVPRPAIVVASSRRARPASNGTRAKPRRARARRSIATPRRVGRAVARPATHPRVARGAVAVAIVVVVVVARRARVATPRCAGAVVAHAGVWRPDR
jgi:hypothetical protein